MLIFDIVSSKRMNSFHFKVSHKQLEHCDFPLELTADEFLCTPEIILDWWITVSMQEILPHSSGGMGFFQQEVPFLQDLLSLFPRLKKLIERDRGSRKDGQIHPNSWGQKW